MQRIHTYYDTLKVARDAPTEVIKSAYRTLARKYHPDSNPDLEEAVREMQALNQAFEVLTDPAQRRAHDEWIDQQISGNPAEASHQGHKPADKSSSKGDQRNSPKYPAAGKIWFGWLSFNNLKPVSVTLIMAVAAGFIALVVVALSGQGDPPSAKPKATAASSTSSPASTPASTPTPAPPVPSPTADLELLAVGDWQWGRHLINFQSGGRFTEHGPEGDLVSTGAWRVVDGRQVKLMHSNGYVSVMQIHEDQITGGALCTSPSGKSHTVYLVKRKPI